RWVRPVAEVFGELNARHVLVVHSTDGLDEISLAAPTRVAELKDRAVSEYQVAPGDFGLEAIDDIGKLAVDSAGASLELVRSALGGSPGPAADMIALNAGAAIYAADAVQTLGEGVTRAREILASGAGLERLEARAGFTQRLGSRRS